MSGRVWRNHAGKIAPFCCKALIFTRFDGRCFITPVLVHHINHYTQDLDYKIPSDWLFHNSLSIYIDCNGWVKYMAHFASICCSSTFNPQLLCCDIHVSSFDDRALDILKSHHIHYFFLKTGGSVHDQTNNNGPKLKLNNLYCNARMNWMINYGTPKFNPAHMNSVLVETWKALKLSSATINQRYFKKTHLIPRYPPAKYKNHQACLAANQISNYCTFD